MRKELKGIKELHEARSVAEEEPWILLRSQIVSALTNKRRELGIPQKDIADVLGVSRTNVTRFESLTLIKKGKIVDPPNPTIKFIAAYAAALGVDIQIQLIPSAKE